MRKFDQRDTHIPRAAATLIPMPPTLQCTAGGILLHNPHDRINLPDNTRLTLGPGEETLIPPYVRLWNGVALTYTVPFVNIFSSLTDDDDMADDDSEH